MNTVMVLSETNKEKYIFPIGILLFNIVILGLHLFISFAILFIYAWSEVPFTYTNSDIMLLTFYYIIPSVIIAYANRESMNFESHKLTKIIIQSIIGVIFIGINILFSIGFYEVATFNIMEIPSDIIPFILWNFGASFIFIFFYFLQDFVKSLNKKKEDKKRFQITIETSEETLNE